MNVGHVHITLGTDGYEEQDTTLVDEQAFHLSPSPGWRRHDASQASHSSQEPSTLVECKDAVFDFPHPSMPSSEYWELAPRPPSLYPAKSQTDGGLEAAPTEFLDPPYPLSPSPVDANFMQRDETMSLLSTSYT